MAHGEEGGFERLDPVEKGGFVLLKIFEAVVLVDVVVEGDVCFEKGVELLLGLLRMGLVDDMIGDIVENRFVAFENLFD